MVAAAILYPYIKDNPSFHIIYTTILHHHTGAVMTDLTVETTPEWYRPALNQLQGKHPASFTPAPQGKDHATLPLCLHYLLPSKWFLPYYLHDSALHLSGHCHTRLHSPLKTVLGKIRDWYQAYCTTYKMHAITTCHGGTGHPLDRGLDVLTEDPEHSDIDNDSTHSLDVTVAFRGPETVGHPEDPVYNDQERLTVLTREIINLHQRVAAGEGQPVETLDCIQHELQSLLIAIHHPQPPAPA